MCRDLDTVDYDELLEAGHRTHKKSRRESRARKHEPVASDNEVEEDKASEGSEEEAGLEAGEKLLPTEDDFLRLDDMEAFVQVLSLSHSSYSLSFARALVLFRLVVADTAAVQPSMYEPEHVIGISILSRIV